MNALRLSATLTLLFLNAIGRADPLDSWTWQNPSPTGNALHRIAYGNGLFVAVGAFGTIVTSSDAVNWTLRQWSGDNILSGIAYGNRQFVVLGYSDTDSSTALLTSADGVNWVQHKQLPNSFNASSICFGNGHFLASGFGSIATSVDGVIWVEQDLGMGYTLGRIAYGNGQFVAVGSLGTNSTILTSADGLTWIQRQLGTQYGGLAGVVYGNGQFVTVGYVDAGVTAAVVMTSGDGVNWVQHQSISQAGTYAYLADVAYGNGQFVAVGEGATIASAGSRGGAILTSFDGVKWFPREARTPNALFSVAYANGQFVAVGETGAILVSVNVTNWVQGLPVIEDQLNGIAYGNGQFVAVGQVNTPGTTSVTLTPSILTSKDGAEWARRDSGLRLGSLSSVAYGNGRFVTLCNADLEADTSPVLTSSNGMTWARSQMGKGYWLSGLAFDGTQFVAASLSGAVLTSADGVKWDQRQPDSTDSRIRVQGVALGNGKMVTVGGSWVDDGFHGILPFSIIQTSTDGVNWVASFSGTITNYWLFGIVYATGQFVAVGSRASEDLTFGGNGIVLTSTDGVNWIERQAGSSPSLRAVSFWNGRFVAVGNGILSSGDGLNWGEPSPGLQSLSAVAYGNGRFVAVGDKGRILESGSVITLSLTRNAAAGLPTLSLSGPTGLAYYVQSSTDLISWRNLTNVISVQPINVIFDAQPAGSDPVFYRAYSE